MISIPLSKGEKGSPVKGWGGDGRGYTVQEGRAVEVLVLRRMPLPAALKDKYMPACWLPRNACCAWNGCDLMHRAGPWKSGLLFVSK